jgi:hypothetical protein
MTQLFEEKIRLMLKVVGTIGHNNKLFDRTCPQCHSGWYSSAEHANCPKCGTQLTFITTEDGTRMAISEGTLYPILGNRGKQDAEQTAKRKNGLLPMYRFKMFSFAKAGETLVLPAAHMRCRKGAVVEVTLVNHQPTFSYYQGKDGHHVEVLMSVYPGFGDSIRVLRDAREVASYEDKVPVGLDPQAELAWLKKRVADIEGGQVPATGEQMNLDMPYIDPAAMEDNTPPLFNGEEVEAGENIKEVLGNASVATEVQPFGME